MADLAAAIVKLHGAEAGFVPNLSGNPHRPAPGVVESAPDAAVPPPLPQIRRLVSL